MFIKELNSKQFDLISLSTFGPRNLNLHQGAQDELFVPAFAWTHSKIYQPDISADGHDRENCQVKWGFVCNVFLDFHRALKWWLDAWQSSVVKWVFVLQSFADVRELHCRMFLALRHGQVASVWFDWKVQRARNATRHIQKSRVWNVVIDSRVLVDGSTELNALIPGAVLPAWDWVNMLKQFTNKKIFD